ncbi:uncharacterized protein LOC127287966 [Leptopilina boulardi]|uniref:uncharacterized protein LOC127287966 n=1 Tax=Leptopilina boulardi TaxID=63433 RepID=UPI0021F685E2|nr:uncharacterized protein LOC127287966 [Leptopilina boulardi]
MSRLINRSVASRITMSWDELKFFQINRTMFISRCSDRFAESRSEYLTVYLAGQDDQTPLLLIVGRDIVPAPVAQLDAQNPIAEGMKKLSTKSIKQKLSFAKIIMMENIMGMKIKLTYLYAVFAASLHQHAVSCHADIYPRAKSAATYTQSTSRTAQCAGKSTQRFK